MVNAAAAIENYNKGMLTLAAVDNRQRLNLVGRVTACPERSRMGAHRRPLAARRGLRALTFPVAATRGVSVATNPAGVTDPGYSGAVPFALCSGAQGQ
jgi:hypothetical protein